MTHNITLNPFKKMISNDDFEFINKLDSATDKQAGMTHYHSSMMTSFQYLISGFQFWMNMEKNQPKHLLI